jgi:hypothetical protein
VLQEWGFSVPKVASRPHLFYTRQEEIILTSIRDKNPWLIFLLFSRKENKKPGGLCGFA